MARTARGLGGGDRDRRWSSRRRARSISASSSTASRASRCRTGRRRSRYLSELCWAGARRRYHPLTSAVVKRLAHELDVIERAGLAEFFLICWDLMRFAKEQGIPAQGRGSATSSIVSYTLGISRVEPIAHNLLFERFINAGRTTYPDVDIDFSSERREEVIQYIYGRYGPEHTGMVCNLVTYRARSAVREVGYALGFPRPLVDRVAKALETYDSVMVRRDLEADGGFAEFFRRTGEGLPGEARAAEARRGARPRRRDGPAEHAGPARREGAALAPAAEAGGPERAATVRLAPGGDGRSAAGRRTIRWRRATAIRGGGTSDDEGGPGDTPASVAWLRAGRGTGYEADATGSSRRRSWTAGHRSRERPARAAAAPDRQARPAEPLGSAATATRGPGRRRARSLGRPRRAGAAAAGPRRLHGRA